MVYINRSRVIALVGLAVVASLVYFLFARIGLDSRPAAYDVKIAAARTTLAAEEAIRDSRDPESLDLELVPDPTESALIGLPTSPITTEPGSLRAKITSTNPNFAAVIVDFLRQAGVGEKDVVAVAYTGSFPALDIATVAAVEALGADPVIVSSVGASTWGANDPELTILDMESLLVRKGIVGHRSVAASVGGSFRLRPLSAEGRQLAETAIARNGVIYLNASRLQEAIQQRLAIYDQETSGRPIKAFVNVGGGLPSTGGVTGQMQFSPGLTIGPARGDVEAEGLMFYMRERGVPVINLTDIVDLARQHRLPVAPQEMPDIGSGTPYRDWPRIRIIAGVAAALLILLMLAVRLVPLLSEKEPKFDPYFGLLPQRLRRGLAAFLRPLTGRVRPQPTDEPPPGRN